MRARFRFWYNVRTLTLLPVSVQRFSQGGLIRCRALERVAEDMLAMAPDQAPDPGAADISARGLRAFFRLDSDGPTVRDGRAYFGSGAAPDGAAAGACTATETADGAADTLQGSARGSLRPGVAGCADGGGSELGMGHGGMASSAGPADASGDGSGSGGRGLLQVGAPQAAAGTPAAARGCGDGGAGGDADVELPIVTPFSHRLQDVLQRVAAAPVRPAWRAERGATTDTTAMRQADHENAASGRFQAEPHSAWRSRHVPHGLLILISACAL